MKDFYEIDRESLVELSKKIYEEACLGYMDLKESVCENLVEEFLKDKNLKKADEVTNLSGLNWTVSQAGNWDGGIGVPPSGVVSSSTGSLDIRANDPASDVAGIVITSTTFDTEVSLRNTDQDMLNGL